METSYLKTLELDKIIWVALRLQSQQLLSSFLAHAALGCTRNDLIKL